MLLYYQFNTQVLLLITVQALLAGLSSVWFLFFWSC